MNCPIQFQIIIKLFVRNELSDLFQIIIKSQPLRTNKIRTLNVGVFCFFSNYFHLKGLSFALCNVLRFDGVDFQKEFLTRIIIIALDCKAFIKTNTFFVFSFSSSRQTCLIKFLPPSLSQQFEPTLDRVKQIIRNFPFSRFV